jgi:hypothetical protein
MGGSLLLTHQNVSTMSSIINQIILALNLMFGPGNYNSQANEIYCNGDYTVTKTGIVIIDADEL